MSTSTRSPVSGSTSERTPPSGSSPLARVEDLDGDHLRGRRRSAAQRARPGERGRGSRRRRRPGRAAGQRRARATSASPRLSLGASSGATPAASTRSTRAERAAAAARRQHARVAASRHATTPTRPPRRTARRADDLRDALGDVALEPVRGAERHRRRTRRPRSHVVSARSGTCWRTCGHAGAGARRGVDLPHVVADLVRAQLRELGARRRRRSRGARRAGARRRGARARGRARRRRPRGIGPGPWRPGGRRARRSRGRSSAAHRAGPSTASRTRLEHVVGGDAVGERLVAQHEPVAQHVGRQVADVARR